MADTETVLANRQDGFLRITLNRPDRLNAFNEAMHHDLRELLADARTDRDIRAVLLTGAGRGFCAGQDLSDRDMRDGGEAPDLGHTIETLYNPLIRQIRSLAKPVVCAVNGVAAGAGANIAFACDIVLAGHSAKFIQAFSRIGLVPDSGGSWLLPRLIGEARAKALTLTGEPLPAQTAADWGLIWKAVPDADLMSDASALAARLAAGATTGLGLTKQLIQDAADQSLDAHLDAERDAQRQAGRTADYREGVAAFLEKRPTRFSGS
ncbi:2-(1,2-epoxy-1,2-dihydrophenyl)acetyl-CoA isomerase PaaG [Roseibium salinum]|uniref:2-(1,2-epoxy-1,2-dihydrophenyl)acetyl-CoA isomerase PaaG n=1 Tax=Roseibium salinum TaxID=1604349 RepID=A0ABT3R0Y7_9HYPH|nr:2-(1,2-epoxy-1,2-dihydrophenyl)acetyl-CoA isomerase PaaG [Roseibium sp. DSM 29163]MCX2722765.1 2-(1,2-epoxy-1,2-dihydrophenyl)acetyl-CoA isomerase PaaG [Roseibium sp. DSM 29163]